MAQRLVRARRKIEHAGIPYRVPPPELLEERLNGVLAVLYLAFNAGYTDAALADVASTAVLLAEAVVDLMPASPKRVASSHYCCCNRPGASRGRVQLAICSPSRSRTARCGSVPTSTAAARRWLPARERGPYVLQARIAECHATATCAERTDWSWIVALYDELLHQLPTPVVALNRAIAVGMRDGPDAGLALLDNITTELDGFHLVQAAQADLLRRAGRTTDAAERYRQAIALAPTARERGQLELRLATLTT